MKKGIIIEGKTPAATYRTILKIGSGGFGCVWQMEDLKTGSHKAIKFLHPKYASNAKLKDRFKKCGQNVKKLDHQNIVRVFETGEWDNIPYLIMEYVDGRDLRKFVETERSLFFKDALQIMYSLLEALDYAHEKGIVHMDIWPPNILMTADGVPKLTDFDLANVKQETDEFRKHTEKVSRIIAKSGLQNIKKMEAVESFGAILGQYTSPEVAIPEPSNPADRRADIFSMGKVLFFMLVGKPMYSADPPSLVKGYGIPYFIDDIIIKAIKDKKDERYSTAGCFLQALKKGPEKENEIGEFCSKSRDLLLLIEGEEPQYKVTLKENIPRIKAINREVLSYATEHNIGGKSVVSRYLREIEEKIEIQKKKDLDIMTQFQSFIHDLLEDKEKCIQHEEKLLLYLDKLKYFESVCEAWGPPFAP
jgi:serine/threonine protein kinase